MSAINICKPRTSFTLEYFDWKHVRYAFYGENWEKYSEELKARIDKENDEFVQKTVELANSKADEYDALLEKRKATPWWRLLAIDAIDCEMRAIYDPNAVWSGYDKRVAEKYFDDNMYTLPNRRRIRNISLDFAREKGFILLEANNTVDNFIKF